MRNAKCCVAQCKSIAVSGRRKFYKFSVSKHKVLQREKWIEAVKKVNPHGWEPNENSLICSSHFIDNKKSDEELNPSYVPSIFPATCGVKRKNQIESSSQQHDRFIMKRKLLKKQKMMKNQKITQEHRKTNLNEILFINIEENYSYVKETIDKECQVFVIPNSSSTQPGKTFTCNRYIYEGGCRSDYCDAEIQTDIIGNGRVIILPCQKKFENKSCGTVQRIFADKSVGPDIEQSEPVKTNFSVSSSGKTEKRLLDIYLSFL